MPTTTWVLTIMLLLEGGDGAPRSQAIRTEVLGFQTSLECKSFAEGMKREASSAPNLRVMAWGCSSQSHDQVVDRFTAPIPHSSLCAIVECK